ncbi:hypothetical protein ACJJTC_019334 [Scirpophaga incertulas]
MKHLAVFLLLLAAASSSASPQGSRWEVFTNVRVLIEDLVANLRSAADQAGTAIQTFENGLIQQGALVREKLLADLENLRIQVEANIQGVVDKLSVPGTVVMQCIDESRKNTDAVINLARSNAIACTDARITDISSQIEDLKNLTSFSTNFANAAIADMQECTANNSNNFLSLGVCLGTVALRAQVTGALLLTQSATSIGRLTLKMGTITTAMEICAGREVVTAGIAIGKIIVQIGTCSASSFYENMNNSTNTANNTTVS